MFQDLTLVHELGFVVVMYVLTRLVPAKWRSLWIPLTSIATVVTLLVAADLALRSFGATTLAKVAARSVTEPPSTKKPAMDETPKASPTGDVSASVTRADGGSVVTELGYGIAVAKGSSLKREWIAVHDPNFPADLEGTPGVRTVYISKQYSGEYRYRSDFELIARKQLRAFEVRFLVFDVWGNHVNTLAFEEVADVPSDSTGKYTGEWNIYSENDVEMHYASIAFMARARLEDGRVVDANLEPVLREALKFTSKFTAADLEPEPKKKGGAETDGDS